MKLTKSQIKHATTDKRWQRFRKNLKYKTTRAKLKQLRAYLTTRAYSKEAKIQVQNYVNALKRAGQL